MSLLAVIVRIVFFAAAALAVVGTYSDRVTPGLRRVGLTTALVSGLVLLGLRVALRVWMPERVPSFSG